MKIINDKESSRKIIVSVVLGVAVGLAAMLVLLAVFAFIMFKLDLGDNTGNVFSMVSLLVSAALCGLVSSKKLGSKIMLIAPFSGFVFYLIIAIIGIAVTRDMLGKQAFLKWILCVLTAGVGAFLGVLKGSKNTVI